MARKSKPLVAKRPASLESTRDLWGIPERIERANRRLESPFGQQTLAAAAGITQPTVSQIMSYKRLETMRVLTALGLAKALQVTLDWLLLGHGEVIPPARN